MRPKNVAILLATAAVWVGLDQLTKEWALSRLADGPEHIFGPLWFTLTFNSGSAFGISLLSGLWLGLLAIAVVVLLFIYSHKLPGKFMSVLLGLLIGGAVGNLLDRLFRAGDGFLSGKVVDFIDFRFWPIFNIADIGIVIGAIGAALIASRPSADEIDEAESAELAEADIYATDSGS